VTARFEDALVACVKQIPPGKVATCGAVARALGDIRAAKAVAEWLRERPELDPSRSVVRADGRPLRSLSATRRRVGSESASIQRIEADRFVDHLEAVPLLTDLRAEQRLLAARVRERDEPGEIETLGGVDVAYADQRAFAVAVLLDARNLDVLEIARCEHEVDFPYIPSYLAFREFPAIQRAVSALQRAPDVLFVDGHGRLHPAHFGSACYAGVFLDMPTIGIAKHLLVGTPSPSPRTPTDAIPIALEGRIEGYAWRPPRAPRAFYVSVGHRVGLDRALRLAQRSTRDRYPEPLRIADRATKEEKDKKKGERLASGPAATRRLHSQKDQGI
jgi:deoxyribonuclease V